MPLNELVLLLRRRWMTWSAVLLVALALGALAIVLQRPSYTATSKAFISVRVAQSATDLNQGSTFVQQVAKSYAGIATTPYILRPVAQQLDLDLTAEELSADVQATAGDDTSIIEIDATSHSPQTAAQIANLATQRLASAVPDLSPNSEGTGATVKVTQVQQAVAPALPSSPNVPLYVTIAALLGLFAGVSLTVLQARLDRRLRSIADVSVTVDAPILGSTLFDRDAAARPLVMLDSEAMTLGESYRTLRTNLQFTARGEAVPSFVVTSSVQGEGKSTLVANLAIALSDSGRRVLVIDADMRRPRMAQYFGLIDAVGLSELLIGQTSIGEAAQQWGETNIHVLPAGVIPPNPSELLSSPAMADLLRAARSEYDVVLIDTPPLLPVTDATLLAGLCTGALVVCSLRGTHRNQLAQAIDVLGRVEAPVLGVAVTMVPNREAGYYGYGYGYSEQRPKGRANGLSARKSMSA